jgi:hypothetical protein
MNLKYRVEGKARNLSGVIVRGRDESSCQTSKRLDSSLRFAPFRMTKIIRAIPTHPNRPDNYPLSIIHYPLSTMIHAA